MESDWRTNRQIHTHVITFQGIKKGGSKAKAEDREGRGGRQLEEFNIKNPEFKIIALRAIKKKNIER